jgi:hypothetical protein
VVVALIVLQESYQSTILDAIDLNKKKETAPAAASPSLAYLDRGIRCASITHVWSASLDWPSPRGPAHLAMGT